MFASQAQALKPHMWRRQMAQFVQVLHVIAMALAVWKGLSLVTNTESPVVVVLSGSMEPAFHRGDLLFLTMTSKPIEPGEITVYRVPDTEIPIVHRVIEARDKYVLTADHSGRRGQLLLTKGDNNQDDDIMLYRGPRWISSEQIVGRVQGFVPLSHTAFYRTPVTLPSF